jgi:hypothetical protein
MPCLCRPSCRCSSSENCGCGGIPFTEIKREPTQPTWPGRSEPTVEFDDVPKINITPAQEHAVDVLIARHDRSGK